MTTEEQFCEKCGAANAPSAQFCQNCAAPLPSVTHITGSLLEETLLGDRYQLLSRIGQGGMGAVYKAKDTRLRPHRCHQGNEQGGIACWPPGGGRGFF